AVGPGLDCPAIGGLRGRCRRAALRKGRGPPSAGRPHAAGALRWCSEAADLSTHRSVPDDRTKAGTYESARKICKLPAFRITKRVQGANLGVAVDCHPAYIESIS